MKKATLPTPNRWDGQIIVVADDIKARNGVYYSNGKEWKKLTDVFSSSDFNITTEAERKLVFDIDTVSKRKTRKIIMPDEDVDLGKLFNTDNWNQGNQFSWMHIQSSETLTIPQRRLMVVQGAMLIEGTLILKGELATL